MISGAAARFALRLAAPLAAALVLMPSAGVAARTPSADIVGAGTLAWERVVVRAAPNATASRVALLHEFRADYRPQYVLAVGRVVGREGRPTWFRISVPGRPNGRSGWVRAAAVELHPVRKRLVVFRGTRRFQFWDGARLVRMGRVAVGKPGAETPLGLFYVTWKFDPTVDPSWAILGAYAFETSAYSNLSDWPGGGIVGVHGTPNPELLGQAVSHGCVRMSNANIEFLRNRVPLGTPVEIVR